jgi:hypothetical protein
MKTTDKDNQILTKQLKEWSVQIAVLGAKHDAATVTAKRFAHELAELRIKHYAATQQLRELELHENGMSMWENIGCGG